MSNYNSLKATINANIKQNGNQEITGQILNSVLNQMVNILGTGYQFAGVATIATNPGTPDAKVFYIANGKGKYEKFGGINVTEDDVVVLYWDSSWHKVSTGIASDQKLSELAERLTTKILLSLPSPTQGYYLTSGSFSRNGNFRCYEFDVEEGQIYYLNNTILKNAQVCGIMIKNDSDNIVSYIANQDVFDNYLISIPATASKMYISSNKDAVVQLFNEIWTIPDLEERLKEVESEQSISNFIKGELYKSVNVDFSALDKVNTFPSGDNLWRTDMGYSSYIIKVTSGITIKVVAHPTQSSYICFLKNLDGYLRNGASVNYATGFSGSGLKIVAGQEVYVTAPSDALYLLAIAYTTTDITPQSATILERRTDDIVNNLTDGGSKKALSAEMGKKIGSILFKKVADEDQTQDLTPTTWYDGQYIRPDGMVDRSEAYAISREPISLLTDEILEVTTSANNVAIISKVITLGREYKPLVTEQNNDSISEKTYTYIADEPTSVMVSVKKTKPYSVVVKQAKNINRIEYIEQELNNLLSNFNGIKTINLKKTDYISTTRNYILREIDENGVKYFMYSNDLGITWTKTQNTIGDIQFVHWFSDGTCLVCGVTKAYTTKDFVSFDESSVYNKDGSTFSATTRTFFRLGNYNSEYRELNGKEVLVWNDYGTEGGYVSRVWFTEDYGKTIKCLLTGSEIGVRHFHRTLLFDNAIWITSGDDGGQCKLIKGEFNGGSWAFNVIGQGNEYKLGQFNIVPPYAVFITDYTDGQRPTGMVKCPIDKLNDASNFEYIFKINGNPPVSSYWEDSAGNRVILPDGIGYKKLWFAKKNFKFSEVDIVCDDNIAPMTLIGPNYNGECTVIGVAGYDAASSLHLNDKRYMLSDAMKEAGVNDFGFISEVFVE